MEPSKNEPLANVGVVKWFDTRKGFGFITDERARDVFVHYSVIEGHGFRKLHDSEKVQYTAVINLNRLCAARVRRFEPANPPRTRAPDFPRK